MIPARIAVVGAGPAGLIAAQVCAQAGAQVDLYDRMRLPGRKFLLAGRGGLNLTHAEPFPAFVQRYGEASDWIKAWLEAFSAQALRDWATDLGQQTFEGSSGRVFPRVMKSSPLLRAWLARLTALGVTFRPHHRFVTLEDGGVVFQTGQGLQKVHADAVILALGGASWPELGSDAGWVPALAKLGVAMKPFKASNSGVVIDWPPGVVAHAGSPLKPLALRVGTHRVRGEAIVTHAGLEGGAIYACHRMIRRVLDQEGRCVALLDFKPDSEWDSLADALKKRNTKRSLSSFLQSRLGLSRAASAIIRMQMNADPALSIASAIKSCPLTITGLSPIARAISTAGGVALQALEHDLSLHGHKHVFVAGEMIDWDAPTGGYLLQACFSTGVGAARGALAFVQHQRNAPVNSTPA